MKEPEQYTLEELGTLKYKVITDVLDILVTDLHKNHPMVSAQIMRYANGDEHHTGGFTTLTGLDNFLSHHDMYTSKILNQNETFYMNRAEAHRFTEEVKAGVRNTSFGITITDTKGNIGLMQHRGDISFKEVIILVYKEAFNLLEDKLIKQYKRQIPTGFSAIKKLQLN